MSDAKYSTQSSTDNGGSKEQHRGDNDDCTMVTFLQRDDLQLKELVLLEATRRNDIDQLEKLLSGKVDVNARNSLDRTALHWAAANGHVQAMRLLLEAGANPAMADKLGMKPILWAAWFGHAEVIRVLSRRRDADFSVANRQGMGLLHCAAVNDNISVVQYLGNSLGAGFNVDAVELRGRTALHLAAEKGLEKMVENLIYIQVNVVAKDRAGLTALHLAALGGHDSICENLLKIGHNVNEVDLEDRTPIYLAAEEGHVTTVKTLLLARADRTKQTRKLMTPLMIATTKGHALVIALLIKTGLKDGNFQNTDGCTALHLSALYGQAEVCRLLVLAGCLLDLLNEQMQTPLHIAIEKENQEIVRLLLAAGSDLEIKDKTGKNYLGIAKRAGSTAVIDLIIKGERLSMLRKLYPPKEQQQQQQQQQQEQQQRLSLSEQQEELRDIDGDTTSNTAEDLSDLKSIGQSSVDQNANISSDIYPNANPSPNLSRNTSDLHVDDLVVPEADTRSVLSFASDRTLMECAKWLNPGEDSTRSRDALSLSGSVASSNKSGPRNSDSGGQQRISDRRSRSDEQAVSALSQNRDVHSERGSVVSGRGSIVSGRGSIVSGRGSIVSERAGHYQEGDDLSICTLQDRDQVDCESLQGHDDRSLSGMKGGSLDIYVTQLVDDALLKQRNSLNRERLLSETTIVRSTSIRLSGIDRESLRALEIHSPDGHSVPDNTSLVQQRVSSSVNEEGSVRDYEIVDRSDQQSINSSVQSTDDVFTPQPVDYDPDLQDLGSLRSGAIFFRRGSDESSVAYEQRVRSNSMSRDSFCSFENAADDPTAAGGRVVPNRVDYSTAMRDVLWKLATKWLNSGDWRSLARHWQFNEQQISAIEHQYTTSHSYRTHGYRMLLIWLQCLVQAQPDCHPVAQLYDGLVAIGKRKLAETVRKTCNKNSYEKKACSIS